MLQEVCARPCKLANAYPLMFCLQNTCIHVQQLPCPTFCLALSLSGRDEMFGQSRQRSFQRAASQRVVGSYCSCVRVHFQSVFNCVSIVLSVCLPPMASDGLVWPSPLPPHGQLRMVTVSLVSAVSPGPRLATRWLSAPSGSAVEPGSTLVVGYTRDAVKTLECNGFRFGLSKAF